MPTTTMLALIVKESETQPALLTSFHAALADLLLSEWTHRKQTSEIDETQFSVFDNAFSRSRRESPFHCAKKPPIQFLDYVERLYKYMRCSPECFAIAVELMHRFAEMTNCVVCELNIFRLWSTACCVAVKATEDDFYTNSYYSQVAGVRTFEFCALEVYFLAKLRWTLFVSPQQYCKWEAKLVAKMHCVPRSLFLHPGCLHPRSVTPKPDRPPSEAPFSSPSLVSVASSVGPLDASPQPSPKPCATPAPVLCDGPQT